MKIYGLQKLTLLDYPEKTACTVFLGGCDFRCPFCHNYELIDGTAKPVMETEELFLFLKKRCGLLDGVVITGGEPCLHPDLADLLKEIRALGFLVKLDTNGYHPDMLERILSRNLADYVAMDIKNSPAKYAMTAGLDTLDLNRIKDSIFLLTHGTAGYEFRTTVVEEFHTAEDFHEIGNLIKGADNYYLQSFTDRDTVPFGNLHAPSVSSMKTYASIAEEYVKHVHLRGIEESNTQNHNL